MPIKNVQMDIAKIELKTEVLAEKWNVYIFSKRVQVVFQYLRFSLRAILHFLPVQLLLIMTKVLNDLYCHSVTFDFAFFMFLLFQKLELEMNFSIIVLELAYNKGTVLFL